MNLNMLALLLTNTGSNAAIEDILNNSRYEGAIESISKVTAFVDEGSIMFISFVSFLIISVAIWRNVLAGAYAAFPRFWDQVHVAHEENKDVGWIKSIMGLKDKYQDINMGSIKRMLMRILPDVKVLTDFEDDTIEPKTYFTKAIAQMIGVVLIGVFIYNGYYRDTTVVVANFGSELFKRVITSTDPIEIYDRVLATSGTPEFSTDNALTTGDKRINKLAHDAYGTIISKYTDIQSKAKKAELASAIEQNVASFLQGQGAKYYDNDGWDFSCSSKLTATASTMKDTASADGLQQSMVMSFNVQDLGFESTKAVDETWYLTMVAQFTKVNKETNATYKLVLNVGGSFTNSKLTFNNVTGSGGSLKGYSTSSVTFTDGNGNVYTGKWNESENSINFNKKPAYGTYTVSNLSYKVGGKEHKVTTIVLSSGTAAPTLQIEGDASGRKFAWGEKIDANNVKDEDSTEKKK